MKNVNSKWYSTIISLLLIWFLLVLSIWIFRLILNEMKINRAMWDYIKSYAWAESSQELALLWIKKNWYWYVWEIDSTINNKSVVLSENPTDKSLFHPKKDVKIFFKNDWKVDEYSWELEPLWYDIIPLFYIDDTGDHWITNYNFDITSWSESDISWNIVWDDAWLSWKWEDTLWVKKIVDSSWQFDYSQRSIQNFLWSSNVNYLLINNINTSQNVSYKITTTNPWEYFTKPVLNIISSWELWDYRQNLNTRLDNNEFLNILRYSVYSN